MNTESSHSPTPPISYSKFDRIMNSVMGRVGILLLALIVGVACIWGAHKNYLTVSYIMLIWVLLIFPFCFLLMSGRSRPNQCDYSACAGLAFIVLAIALIFALGLRSSLDGSDLTNICSSIISIIAGGIGANAAFQGLTMPKQSPTEATVVHNETTAAPQETVTIRE